MVPSWMPERCSAAARLTYNVYLSYALTPEYPMSVAIGVDVGGTFTDFFVLDLERNRSWVHKTPSTPADPSEAIRTGLREILLASGVAANSVARIAHGTTVATNALIQRRGAKVALIVTEGFRDLLEIGRQTRPHLYSLQIDAPEPVVPREWRIEAKERVLADGTVLVPLTPGELQAVIDRAKSTGAEAFAVCFLFSFLNPSHEAMLKQGLIGQGCSAVSISHEVQPEFREYERMSTTVLNAYLLPLMSGYLGTLSSVAGEIAPRATLGINQSSGGLMSAPQAARFPIRTALSGPAAGAVGAAAVLRASGRRSAITLDMGGTSADVCLIRAGNFSISYEGSVGGFPVRLPMVDVNAVGAGGGSVAWIDRDGLMKVGPMSAGARPGPACYGLGGKQPTVTDANLILGRLDPAGLLDRRLPLDVGRATAAFSALAKQVGTTIEQAALGCIDIVVANMVRAIRAVSVERGHDPKDFALIAFGGGGPLHSRAVAASLGIREVIVPPHPGILCAQGLLAADVTENFVSSARFRVSDSSHAALVSAFKVLRSRAEAWHRSEGTPASGRIVEVSLDMRYVGQNYELSVPVELALLEEERAPLVVEALQNAFQSAHERQYGTSNPEGLIEVVNIRVTARSPAIAPSLGPQADRPRQGPRQTVGSRAVHFDRAAIQSCPIYRRSDLQPGASLSGPAIIEQLDTTTLVFPGDRFRVDAACNLLIEVPG